MKKVYYNLILILFLISSPSWAMQTFDDTDDHIDFGSFIPVSGGAARTVVFWGKKNASIGSSSNQAYVADWGTSGTGTRFSVNIGSNDLRLEIQGTGYDSNATLSNIGQWYHLALVVVDSDFANTLYYIDGEDQSGSPPSATINTGTNNGLEIKQGILNRHKGDLDISDLAIWSSALSQADIRRIHSSRLKRIHCQIEPENLIAYWPLNELADGESGDGKTYRCVCGNNCVDGTGDDGANNTGLLGEADEHVNYP